MICGVDEAGRGPIIGPMVVAAVAVENHSQLPKGLKDSKLLTREKREELFERIARLPHAVRIVPPKEIDEWVFQGRLNWLEAKHMIALLSELGATEAIIDCPSRDREGFAAHIASAVPGCEVRAMFKADQKYKVVSAASIIAKVTRDRLIDAIKRDLGVEFGSGYLTDPRTQSFLDDFDADFPHFRRSWQPYKDRVAGKQQRVLFQ